MIGGYGADYLLPDVQLSRGNGYQQQTLTNTSPVTQVTAQSGYANVIVATTRDNLVGGFGGGTLVTNGHPTLSVLDWLTVHLVVWSQAELESQIQAALSQPWTQWF